MRRRSGRYVLSDMLAGFIGQLRLSALNLMSVDCANGSKLSFGSDVIATRTTSELRSAAFFAWLGLAWLG